MLRFHDEGNEQHVRDSLLKYYSSCSIAHGTYILTFAIGVFTFFEIFTRNPLLWFSPLFFLVLTLFMLLGLYLFVRTLCWGYLTHEVINATAMTFEQAERKFPKACKGYDSFTMSYALHVGSVYAVKKKHETVYSLSGL